MATLTITERGNPGRPTAVTLVRIQEFLRTPFPGFAVERVSLRSFQINVDREQAIIVTDSNNYITQLDSIRLSFQVWNVVRVLGMLKADSCVILGVLQWTVPTG